MRDLCDILDSSKVLKPSINTLPAHVSQNLFTSHISSESLQCNENSILHSIPPAFSTALSTASAIASSKASPTESSSSTQLSVSTQSSTPSQLGRRSIKHLPELLLPEMLLLSSSMDLDLGGSHQESNTEFQTLALHRMGRWQVLSSGRTDPCVEVQRGERYVVGTFTFDPEPSHPAHDHQALHSYYKSLEPFANTSKVNVLGSPSKSSR